MTESVASFGRPRLPWHEELITCALLTWMIVGIHLDGWAHRERDLQDSITTPWHALFYTGFVAAAAWILWVCFRRQRPSRPVTMLRARDPAFLATIPMGYGLGLAGVATFALGGVTDQIWHLALGVEQDLEAFLSPTHWLLAAGMFLMCSSPFRAAWTSFDTARPRFREFLPTLWSITLTLGMVSFAYNYLNLFALDNVSIEDDELFALFGQDVPFTEQYAMAERLRMQGVAAALISTILLIGTSLLVLRRWRPPFGAFTLMYTATVTGVSGVWDFDRGWTIFAAAAAGLAADILVLRTDPRPTRVAQYRIFSAAVPAVLWTSYLAIVAVAYDVGWRTPMWSGLVIFAVPVGVLISFLMEPMAIPAAPTVTDGTGRRDVVETTRELEGTAT